jgi:LacI family transcriptional regulator
MRVTLLDIANRLEISHTTVSRVLNQKADPYISDETRQRVLHTAKEMGYRPNHAARALVTGRTHIVGVWTHAEFSGYYTELFRGLLYQARQRKYQIIPYTEMPTVYATDPSNVAPWLIEGVIACDNFVVVEAMMQSPQYSNTPCVGIGINYSQKADYVGLDLYQGAVEALYFLLASGRKSIAYIADQASLTQNDARHLAYRHCMQEAGRKPEVISLPAQHRAEVRKKFADYLSEKSCPEAIFCHNDEMALGVYRALADRSKTANQEILLVGCDGLDEVNYLDYPFSSIIAPIEEICVQAWQALENRLNAPNMPLQQQILSTHLLIRKGRDA